MKSSFARNIALVIASVGLMSACSSEKSPVGDSIDMANFAEPTHTLTETLLITEDEDFFFGSINYVQPTTKGHVIAADITAKMLHVFDANGDRIGTIGKEGSGPGEFRNISKAYLTVGDTLFVADPNSARITAFKESSSGVWDVVYEIPIIRDDGQIASSFIHLGEGDLIGQGSAFVMVMPGGADAPEPSLFTLGRDGKAIGESFANFRRRDVKIESGTNFVTAYGILFGRGGYVKESRDAIHIGNSEFFGATTINAKGDTIAHFQIPFATRLVTEDEIIERTGGADSDYYKSIRDVIPDTRPAFDGYNADFEGNIYFQLENITDEHHLWLVFNPEGDFVKSFHIKKGITIHHIKDGKLYCTGDIDGEPVIIVYSLG